MNYYAQRLGTVILGSSMPRNKPLDKMPPSGWFRLYGMPPPNPTRQEVTRDVQKYYNNDDAFLNDARVIRRGDNREALDYAAMKQYDSHQEYLNNKPIMNVSVQPTDFDNQDVQDKLATLSGNSEEVAIAIKNFEEKLAILQLSTSKRDELRNEFYKNIVSANSTVLKKIATDEQGKSLSDIMELARQANDLGGKARVIAPIAPIAPVVPVAPVAPGRGRPPKQPGAPMSLQKEMEAVLINNIGDFADGFKQQYNKELSRDDLKKIVPKVASIMADAYKSSKGSMMPRDDAQSIFNEFAGELTKNRNALRKIKGKK